jgi:DNA-binding transcriptional regulator YiaG
MVIVRFLKKLFLHVKRQQRKVVLKMSNDCTPTFIKEMRLKLGMTQEELAQKLGVSFTSVNRWENGQTKPSKLARKQLELLATDNAAKKGM